MLFHVLFSSFSNIFSQTLSVKHTSSTLINFSDRHINESERINFSLKRHVSSLLKKVQARGV